MSSACIFFPFSFIKEKKSFRCSCSASRTSQRPRCKQRGIYLAAPQGGGVFDPRGSRQMDMQACPLGSLLAGINLILNHPFLLLISTGKKRMPNTKHLTLFLLPRLFNFFSVQTLLHLFLFSSIVLDN